MSKPSWSNWYGLKAWKELRLRIFIRDMYQCKVCGNAVHNYHKHRHAAIADHIQPHKGDELLFWDESNIQTLCKSCHDGYKQSLEKGGDGQYKIKHTTGQDGWPITSH